MRDLQEYYGADYKPLANAVLLVAVVKVTMHVALRCNESYAPCRLLLAALRYNENSSRDVMYDDSGNEKMKVSYAKYLGGKGKASKLRPPPTTRKYRCQ